MLEPIRKYILLSAVFLVVLKVFLNLAILAYPKIDRYQALDVNSQELISLTNNYRQSLGLNSLKVNPRLTQAAVNKAQDILEGQYFNHTSPAGKKFSDWIKEVNYDYFYVGENLAIDFSDNQELFQAWLDSPTHRENIIRPQYQEIGLAALSGKYKNHSTIVVVQLFGTRVLSQPTEEVATSLPFNDWASHYFYEQTGWQKYLKLDTLNVINNLTDYLLIIFSGIYIVSYNPRKKKNQINIKQPIVNRYQTKIFREW